MVRLFAQKVCLSLASQALAVLHFTSSLGNAKVSPGEEDDDVTAERARVQQENDETSTDILRIKSLTKTFRKTVGKNCVAVDNITVGVKPGEVFGCCFFH